MIRSSLNAAARPASNLRSDEPIGLCLTLDDARAVLEHWQNCGEHLGFSFFRAADGAFQAGRATVARVGARSLTLDAGDRRFVIAIENACMEFTQAELSRPDFRTIEVEGLSVSLENRDWLFLFQKTTRRARYPSHPVEASTIARDDEDRLNERARGSLDESSEQVQAISRLGGEQR